MLEELDAQFGVGDLVDEEMYQQKKKSYGEKSLSGLRVEHDLNRCAKFNDCTSYLT